MSLPAQLADTLARGIDTLGLPLSDDQQRQLIHYVELLVKWNQAYNLTAIRDPQEMVTRHLLDSLAVLPFVGEGDTLDVGTGAGIPGIILAVSRPQQSFTLLDSNGKKTRFVRQARRELGLDNVEVVHGRVEQYRKAPSQIICRAFASLSDMLALMTSIMTDNTRLLAMKAASTEDELATLPQGWKGHHHSLQVPGLDEARTLVIVESVS
ncbi:MAG: 16S rRNA (guanine(527)-N(7))-methyltransferase RsmG [Pseudomonadales bacterium]|uniref:16S rRNA (guanine(527)-N(7))-methyltransferase RsmG n=1 Tax=Alcanivorax sp. MD8A TaxID=1177157 RepID=UPI000C9D1032|nr:16S rRNA (guanine(527)-N(7))-methyltransferase RsmG [Alcanivorax sp. MD8A]MCG8438834.1 16S rRNA (guanine(527)-N(7))-methyltransferase RsmG [Pseudomonadales bacterium]MED5431621.1 16S rRNA (guanine(527)-N(7))-methyltransferase RsmG [Pseudomonadota bacterium]MEE2870792.1 16S rRNA (guanine(527)-N(7))-methyltransferase RsmG [Pseudomonadota bacterium]PNE04001.1 methyltransferase GidB [Alcanivorax sp. MD8A]